VPYLGGKESHSRKERDDSPGEGDSKERGKVTSEGWAEHAAVWTVAGCPSTSQETALLLLTRPRKYEKSIELE